MPLKDVNVKLRAVVLRVRVLTFLSHRLYGGICTCTRKERQMWIGLGKRVNQQSVSKEAVFNSWDHEPSKDSDQRAEQASFS